MISYVRIYTAPPEKRCFFMVSLAYLVKRRSVEPENRVRSPKIPQINVNSQW